MSWEWDLSTVRQAAMLAECDEGTVRLVLDSVRDQVVPVGVERELLAVRARVRGETLVLHPDDVELLYRTHR